LKVLENLNKTENIENSNIQGLIWISGDQLVLDNSSFQNSLIFPQLLSYTKKTYDEFFKNYSSNN
jgi:hypothetical protein